MKSSILKKLLTIIIVSSFFGCTKFGRNITVKGRVLNPITGEVYEGFEVNLLKSKNLQYYGGFKAIKTTYSDSNGNFELSATRLGSIILSVGNSGYQNSYGLGWYYDGKYYSRLGVDKGKTMNVDYYLVSYGNYQLIINNTNCNGSTDTIIINQTNQVQSFLGKDWVLTGCNGYTTSSEKVPMGNIHTKYTVKKNGITQVFETDFEVLPNQDNIQIINY